MRFWIREIAGWLLVLGGLYFLLGSVSLVLSQPSWVFSAANITVIGIFVFRGGIHLLKVAMAARLASAPQPQPERPKPPLSRNAAPVRVSPEEW